MKASALTDEQRLRMEMNRQRALAKRVASSCAAAPELNISLSNSGIAHKAADIAFKTGHSHLPQLKSLQVIPNPNYSILATNADDSLSFCVDQRDVFRVAESDSGAEKHCNGWEPASPEHASPKQQNRRRASKYPSPQQALPVKRLRSLSLGPCLERCSANEKNVCHSLLLLDREETEKCDRQSHILDQHKAHLLLRQVDKCESAPAQSVSTRWSLRKCNNMFQEIEVGGAPLWNNNGDIKHASEGGSVPHALLENLQEDSPGPSDFLFPGQAERSSEFRQYLPSNIQRMSLHDGRDHQPELDFIQKSSPLVPSPLMPAPLTVGLELCSSTEFAVFAEWIDTPRRPPSTGFERHIRDFDPAERNTSRQKEAMPPEQGSCSVGARTPYLSEEENAKSEEDHRELPDASSFIIKAIKATKFRWIEQLVEGRWRRAPAFPLQVYNSVASSLKVLPDVHLTRVPLSTINGTRRALAMVCKYDFFLSRRAMETCNVKRNICSTGDDERGALISGEGDACEVAVADGRGSMGDEVLPHRRSDEKQAEKSKAGIEPQYGKNNQQKKERIESEWEKEVKERLPHKLARGLLPFQREGLRFGVEREGRCLLGDEMGVGKTVQAIALAAWYREEGPLLVVCPASMRLPWADELERWLPDLDPRDIHIVFGSKDDISMSSALPRITIISFSMLRRLSASLGRRTWGTVIVDESHNMRTTKGPDESEETRTMMLVLKGARRAVLLSGTPSLTRPFDIFNQVDCLRPGLLGRSKYEFARRYCGVEPRKLQKAGANYVNYSKGVRLQELNILLTEAVMIRRLKSDILSQLPPKRRQVIRLHLEPSDIQRARECARNHEVLIKRSKRGQKMENFYGETKEFEGNCIQDSLSCVRKDQKLSRQEIGIAKLRGVKEWLENHAAFVRAGEGERARGEGGGEMERESYKNLVIEDLGQRPSEQTGGKVSCFSSSGSKGGTIDEFEGGRREGGEPRGSREEEGFSSNPSSETSVNKSSEIEKLIIFAHHYEVLDAIQEFVVLHNVEFVRIDGQTQPIDRQSAVRLFHSNPEVLVAIVGVTAGGVGLDFSAATTVVFAEVPQTAADFLQAEDRTHRRGQKRAVNVYVFCAKDSSDEILWQKLSRSIEIVSAAVNGQDGLVEGMQVDRVIESPSTASYEAKEEQKAKTLLPFSEKKCSSDISESGGPKLVLHCDENLEKQIARKGVGEGDDAQYGEGNGALKFQNEGREGREGIQGSEEERGVRGDKEEQREKEGEQLRAAGEGEGWTGHVIPSEIRGRNGENEEKTDVVVEKGRAELLFQVSAHTGRVHLHRGAPPQPLHVNFRPESLHMAAQRERKREGERERERGRGRRGEREWGKERERERGTETEVEGEGRGEKEREWGGEGGKEGWREGKEGGEGEGEKGGAGGRRREERVKEREGEREKERHEGTKDEREERGRVGERGRGGEREGEGDGAGEREKESKGSPEGEDRRGREREGEGQPERDGRMEGERERECAKRSAREWREWGEEWESLREAAEAFFREWLELRAVARKKLFGKVLALPLYDELMKIEGVSNNELEGGSRRRVTPRYEVGAVAPEGATWREVRVKARGRWERSERQAVSREGEPLCQFCKQPCRHQGSEKPRTMKELFCSSSCLQNFLTRTSTAFIREALFDLERGVCVLCGLNCSALVKRIRVLKTAAREKHILRAAPALSHFPHLLKRLVMAPCEGNAWHADHITAVYEGGGECGLENLRTLCVACHANVTSEQRRRWAEERQQKRKIEQTIKQIERELEREESQRKREAMKLASKQNKVDKSGEIGAFRAGLKEARGREGESEAEMCPARWDVFRWNSEEEVIGSCSVEGEKMPLRKEIPLDSGGLRERDVGGEGVATLGIESLEEEEETNEDAELLAVEVAGSSYSKPKCSH